MARFSEMTRSEVLEGPLWETIRPCLNIQEVTQMRVTAPAWKGWRQVWAVLRPCVHDRYFLLPSNVDKGRVHVNSDLCFSLFAVHAHTVCRARIRTTCAVG